MMPIFITLLLFNTSPLNEMSHLEVNYDGQIVANVEREDFYITLLGNTFIDDEKVQKLMDKLHQVIFQKAQNATINNRDEIIDGKPGKTLDKKTFTQDFYDALYRNKTMVNMPTKTIYPEVDGELLERIHAKRIGQYTTYYNQHKKERSTNISLSAKAINNTVIFPNHTFSFNDVVGKRTKEKGYMSAPVIIEGEITEDIGGGICQVSSTLFNAVEQAGLTVTERYSHSRSVRYVPPGRDATVSWYGPDFAFLNNSNQPILIRAKAEKGSVYISIYTAIPD